MGIRDQTRAKIDQIRAQQCLKAKQFEQWDEAQ